MGLLARRKRMYHKFLAELKDILIKDGVTPIHHFQDNNLLNYLACVPLNGLMSWLNITKVNTDLSKEEKDFVNFIVIYKRARKRNPNLLLDTPPEIPYNDSPILGWRENTRFEDEVELYKQKLEEYQQRKQFITKKRNELLRSGEAEVFHYVEAEDMAARCQTCEGTGWMESGTEAAESSSSLNTGTSMEADIVQMPVNNVSIPCPDCSGTGVGSYKPNVTEVQRQMAHVFKTKLDKLKDPVFSYFPCKRKPVFIRLSYEGQVFIKHL